MNTLTRRTVLTGVAAAVMPIYIAHAGATRSDDFKINRFGDLWSFADPSPEQIKRLRYHPEGVFFSGAGNSAADSPAMVCAAPDRAFDAEVTIDLYDGAEGGLLLLTAPRRFIGLGFTPHLMRAYAAAKEDEGLREALETQSVRVGAIVDGAAATFRYSHDDGKTWTPHRLRGEAGGSLSQIGLFSAGGGQIRLRNFTYRPR